MIIRFCKDKKEENMKYNIAVAGATGNIGYEILQTLVDRQFPVGEVFALAAGKFSGGEVSFGDDKILKVQNIKDFDFKGVDIVFFVGGFDVAKDYSEIAVKAGATVIDNSRFLSGNKELPLIVPEINKQDITGYTEKKIASPCSLAVQTAMACKALHDKAEIKRIVLSSYQSVSDKGRRAMDELFNQTKAMYANSDFRGETFAKQISFNVIPQIGDFEDTGNTEEENRVSEEVSRLLGNNVSVSSTCVYVPVFVGHSASVNVEFKNEITPAEARKALRQVEGVVVIDTLDPEDGFVTPVEIAGDDVVYISRIRKDPTVENGLNIWIVADNLRKGSALNMVQIAEVLTDNSSKKK